MPRYAFTIWSAGRALTGERIVVLSDDAAALNYACEFASELRKGGQYEARNLIIAVSDEYRRVVFSISCLPGCA